MTGVMEYLLGLPGADEIAPAVITDLATAEIRRRWVLGGLINEYGRQHEDHWLIQETADQRPRAQFWHFTGERRCEKSSTRLRRLGRGSGQPSGRLIAFRRRTRAGVCGPGEPDPTRAWRAMGLVPDRLYPRGNRGCQLSCRQCVLNPVLALAPFPGPLPTSAQVTRPNGSFALLGHGHTHPTRTSQIARD